LRRIGLALLIVVGLASMSVQANAAPSWNERWQTARFKTLEYPKESFSDHELVLTLKAVSRLKGFSFSRANCIALRESGYNEFARNTYSGAAGVFQHLPNYWPGRADAYASNAGPLAIKPNPSPFNGRANIIVSGSMMGRGMWSHWSSTDSPCY